jgi:hypothetical protein
VGGQIGFELTDFVFILNDASAVRAFSQFGTLTLGGNVSLAAGPVGRNAEAAGAASTKGVAAVFSYSKTKGLFAGVSLEGSMLVERKDANEKMYQSRVSAAQLLTGSVRPPPSTMLSGRAGGARPTARARAPTAAERAPLMTLPVVTNTVTSPVARIPLGTMMYTIDLQAAWDVLRPLAPPLTTHTATMDVAAATPRPSTTTTATPTADLPARLLPSRSLVNGRARVRLCGRIRRLHSSRLMRTKTEIWDSRRARSSRS